MFCDFFSLIECVICLQADLAGQVFRLIKLDFCKVMDSSLSLNTEEFDELLSKYGTKAIEFPVVQVTAQGRKQILLINVLILLEIIK